MMNLMQASGGCGRSMGYGLVGGAITGGGLPKALKAELYATDGKYQIRVDKARRNYDPSKMNTAPKGSAEAKARGAEAARTRRANSARAAQIAVSTARSSGVTSLSEIHNLYCGAKIDVSREHQRLKREQKKGLSARQYAAELGLAPITRGNMTPEEEAAERLRRMTVPPRHVSRRR